MLAFQFNSRVDLKIYYGWVIRLILIVRFKNESREEPLFIVPDFIFLILISRKKGRPKDIKILIMLVCVSALSNILKYQ